MLLVFFNYLHPLARNLEFPIFFSCRWDVGPQGRQPVVGTLPYLINKILGERKVIHAGSEHRPDIIQFNGRCQVEPRTVFEKFGGKSGVGTEKKGRFTVDDARIEVRYRHWG